MKLPHLRSCRAILFCVVVAACSRASAATSPDRATILLKQVKAAMGGAKWDAVTTIEGEGQKKSCGLTGTFQSRDDLATGYFERRAQYGIVANAEGRDKKGRWRQDNSGQTHPLDSTEAVTVAMSESYLSRRGYLFPERIAATFRRCVPAKDSDKGFDCMLVTPEGGRAFSLWVDAATHLPDRAVMELSVGTETIRFADYRAVEGVMLPFKISVEHGDESESGTAIIVTYRVSTTPSAQELIRPQPSTTDGKLPPGVKATSAPAFLDKETGWFIVQAKVNGQGPYPFILDTGGHNILTPEMAHQLGLSSSGKGASNGAGAGSTATEFTKVDVFSVGDAYMVQQPFTILHIDLGTAGKDKAARTPIAGILGLELFERFVVTLDYQIDTVTLEPSEGFEYRGSGKAVPLRFTSDMPITLATLDGHPGPFGIDTGNNTDLIVFRTWALRSGVASHKVHAKEMNGTSVGGALTLHHARARSLEIASVNLGAVKLLLSSDHEGSLSARAEAGNIGNSILSRFKRVTFDYRSAQLYLER